MGVWVGSWGTNDQCRVEEGRQGPSGARVEQGPELRFQGSGGGDPVVVMKAEGQSLQMAVYIPVLRCPKSHLNPVLRILSRAHHP